MASATGGAFPRAIREGALLLFISAALALGVNATRSKPLPMRADPRLLALEVDLPALSQPEAAAAFESGHIFLDAREPDQFRTGHVGGAFSLAPGEFDDRYAALAGFLSSDTPIVLYGDEERPSDLETVARKLQAAGHTQIAYFLDGYGAWAAAGSPVEAGDDPTMTPADAEIGMESRMLDMEEEPGAAGAEPDTNGNEENSE